MGNHEIERFLNYIATTRGVAASTQNQALCAIIFLYRYVIKRDITDLSYSFAKRAKRLPTVLSPGEVNSILKNCSDKYWLIIALLYGCGFRVSEVLSLRIKDIDLNNRSILVFNGNMYFHQQHDALTLMTGIFADTICIQQHLANN